jgi:hypothetical protein
MMTFPIYGKKWKVIKAMFQTTNQIYTIQYSFSNESLVECPWISSFTGHSPRFFATFHGEIPEVPVRNCWL